MISAALLFAYTRTLFGRLTLALRENERRLPALGYDVHMTKVLVFAISGMFSGVAGALLAISTESANYILFHIGTSTSVVLNTIIGGTSIFLGPAIGAVAMTMFGFVASEATRSWLLYQGLIFIAVMLWAPRGLTPLLFATGEGIAQRRIVPARAAGTAVAVVLIAAGVVLAIELLEAIFHRDYAGLVQRTGEWPPVSVLGLGWSPGSPLTWAAPVGLLLLGAMASRVGRSRAGEAGHD